MLAFTVLWLPQIRHDHSSPSFSFSVLQVVGLLGPHVVPLRQKRGHRRGIQYSTSQPSVEERDSRYQYDMRVAVRNDLTTVQWGSSTTGPTQNFTVPGPHDHEGTEAEGTKKKKAR